MKNINRLLVTGVLATTLSGCIIVGGDLDEFDRDYSSRDWAEVERNNRETIAGLSIGEGYEAIKGRLGQAAFSESFKRGDSLYHVLYYRTHRVHSDGETTKDETTPLVFIDKQLIGWGEEALSQIN